MKSKLLGVFLFTLSCGIFFQTAPAQSREMTNAEFCGQFSLVPGDTIFLPGGGVVSTCRETDWDHPLEITPEQTQSESKRIGSRGIVMDGIVMDGIVMDRADPDLRAE